MLFIRKLKSFARFPLTLKLLLIEALFTSARVKLTLKFFPFAKVMHWLGATNTESPEDQEPTTIFTRKQVKQALVLCNKYAFWPTECYTLSLTGKLLLKRRGIKSTLYVGFKKDEFGKYKGHAWLRANDTYISGFTESGEFTLHSWFS
jgi:hypothetical protein